MYMLIASTSEKRALRHHARASDMSRRECKIMISVLNNYSKNL